MTQRIINGVGAVIWLMGSVLLAWIAGGISAQGDLPPSPPDDVLDLARNFSGSNADWTPVIQEFHGVEMVLVPAGCFEMGSENGDGDEKPVHMVCFEDPFWIDQTEVTNAQFAAFNGQAANASAFSGDDRPREQITWTESQVFCESREGRLPTEAEWEYAARGPDGWVYPWGNEWEADKVVWNGNSHDQTANVGSRPTGASWVGALDLSGNVLEWVADWHGPYLDGPQVNPTGTTWGKYRELRGGSWLGMSADLFRAPNRHFGYFFFEDNYIGLRCARSVDADTPRPFIPSDLTPEPIPHHPEDAFLPLGAHNEDWTPVIQDFDGVEMVLVPAGCFMMGSSTVLHRKL